MEPIWGGWRKRSITAWVDATKSFLRYQRLALLACWSRASARVARRSILLSSVPADLPSHMPSCPSAWLQGRQRQMEPEEVKKKKKKSFLLENLDIMTVFQKPRWSGTKLSERFFDSLFLPSLLIRVERNIHVCDVNEETVFRPLLQASVNLYTQ